MEEVKQPAIRVFYSYAREDKLLRDELEKHLGTLKRQGYISHWSDRDISAGKEWKHEIDENLGASDIILLLVSPDFIHSDYCYGVEMKLALERHEAEEARAIPIILRPVDWEEALFSNLQALPTDAKPITMWPNHDEAFLDVAKGIRKVVKELLVEKYLAIAEELSDDDQVEKALVICERSIRLDPTAHEAYNLKVNLLTYLERYEDALLACQQLIDLAPNEADYLEEKAQLLLKLNRHKEALDAFQLAIDLNPLGGYRHSVKGDALYSLGRYEEALDCYQQAIDNSSPGEEWLYSKEKGDTLFALGRFEEAVPAYTTAFEGIPDGDAAAEALKYRGDALFKLGLYEEALSSYVEAVELLEYFYGGTEKPDFRQDAPSYIKGKGDALFKLGRYEEALAAYQQVIELAPETSEHYQCKGDALLALNRCEEAIIAYDRAASLSPTTSTIHFSKAYAYGQLAVQSRNEAIKIELGKGKIKAYEGKIVEINNYHTFTFQTNEDSEYTLKISDRNLYYFELDDEITFFVNTLTNKSHAYIHTRNLSMEIVEWKT